MGREKFVVDSSEPAAKIIVIGVGGAGNNAVNRMIAENMNHVEFFVANTDKQVLQTSQAKNRLILGEKTTHGLGAGGSPEVGKLAAEESKEEIAEIVKGANMVFIAAGMGGGTGTGAAPVIARIAREAKALTIAIVTRPFTFEGKGRIANSVKGLNELREAVDAIIIVSNDKLLMSAGNQPIGQAFKLADDVLARSVKTVTDLILMPAVINLDFADVRNVLRNSGLALIGFGLGQGPNKAFEAAQSAVSSPLLESSLTGASKAIVAVTCGPLVSLYEAQETVDRIREIASTNLDIKFGVNINDQLTDQILVSVIAAQFPEEYDYTTVPSPLTKTAGTVNKIEPEQGLLKPQDPLPKVEVKEDDEDLLPEFLSGKKLS
ncbi:MAG: cell division protein FtsZ [Bacilli bacterium]